jgi:hypothetical protein
LPNGLSQSDSIDWSFLARPIFANAERRVKRGCFAGLPAGSISPSAIAIAPNYFRPLFLHEFSVDNETAIGDAMA